MFETNHQIFARTLRERLAMVGLFPAIIPAGGVVRIDVFRLSRYVVREPKPRLVTWFVTDEEILAARSAEHIAMHAAGMIDLAVDERIAKWNNIEST